MGLRQTVPVRPNAGRAIGQVEDVRRHPARGQDAIVSFRVERTEDVAGMPNFVAAETGHSIQVTVRRDGEFELHAGARVQLTVHYLGDERGGGFYANASECQVIEPDASSDPSA